MESELLSLKKDQSLYSKRKELSRLMVKHKMLFIFDSDSSMSVDSALSRLRKIDRSGRLGHARKFSQMAFKDPTLLHRK